MSLTDRLQTVVPFWGDGGSVALRTLRLILVLVGLLGPVFWLVYQHATPGAVDPGWIRALQSGAALVLLTLSYTSSWVRARAHALLAVVLGSLLVYFGALAAANELDANFASGYQFVVLGAALAASVAWDRPGPLAAVLFGGVAVGVAAAAWAGSEAGATSPAMFLLVTSAGSLVFFIGFYGRLRISSELRRSESQLAEAERLAGTGSWTHTLATDRWTWSDGVYAVVGIEPDDAPPPLGAFVHPDDRPAYDAETERLVAERTPLRTRYRIVRPDGAVRWLDATARVHRRRRGLQLRGVVLDVTEHVGREAALEAARDQAEVAGRAKSGFLANMSHEIRTPLTAIIGYAQVLQEEVAGEHAALVAPIEMGGRRLLGTLNSVLDLARLDSGGAELALRPVDVPAEAAEVVSLLRSQAERKGLALLLAPPPAPLLARADPDALGRVLANLVSNAVKFTDAGRVLVRVREAGGRAEIAVADTGRGMDAAFLEDLYSPFHQASSGWARSHEGTGLGLTITQRLTSAMGGEIRVESEPGRGTTFTVLLPLAGRTPEARALKASAPAPAGA